MVHGNAIRITASHVIPFASKGRDERQRISHPHLAIITIHSSFCVTSTSRSARIQEEQSSAPNDVLQAIRTVQLGQNPSACARKPHRTSISYRDFCVVFLSPNREQARSGREHSRSGKGPQRPPKGRGPQGHFWPATRDQNHRNGSANRADCGFSHNCLHDPSWWILKPRRRVALRAPSCAPRGLSTRLPDLAVRISVPLELGSPVRGTPNDSCSYSNELRVRGSTRLGYRGATARGNSPHAPSARS